MADSNPDRVAAAERMRGYFEVQLMLAERLAVLRGQPLGEAALFSTNLHRRFALGRPEHAVAPAWEAYAQGLEQAGSAAERLDWTSRFFAARPPEPPPAGHVAFGCFSFEPPTPEGLVRIHFNNRDSADGVGPLASAKAAARRDELARLSACLKREHPTARTIIGGSWLYNLEAYRRLFPPVYGGSRTPPASLRLTGTSSWGQFISHTGQVHPERRAAFLANLDRLDPDAPWRAFPLPALSTHAPVEAFYAFYGV